MVFLQQCEVEAQTFTTTPDLDANFRIGKYLNIHFGFDPKVNQNLIYLKLDCINLSTTGFFL